VHEGAFRKHLFGTKIVTKSAFQALTPDLQPQKEKPRHSRRGFKYDVNVVFQADRFRVTTFAGSPVTTARTWSAQRASAFAICAL